MMRYPSEWVNTVSRNFTQNLFSSDLKFETDESGILNNI